VSVADTGVRWLAQFMGTDQNYTDKHMLTDCMFKYLYSFVQC